MRHLRDAYGARSINLGVETPDPVIASIHKREFDDAEHQERIIAKRLAAHVGSLLGSA